MSTEPTTPPIQHWADLFQGKDVIIQMAPEYITGSDKAGNLNVTPILRGRLSILADDGGKKKYVLGIRDKDGDSLVAIPPEAVLYMTVFVPPALVIT